MTTSDQDSPPGKITRWSTSGKAPLLKRHQAHQARRECAGGALESNFLGMVRDALGGIGGSSLSIFTGFSKDFEKLNFQKLKIDQNRFKMG